ncbi:hypothetical protein ACFVMC_07225 [Nocardia sp. NPDC127579]|uniref:maltokinase N-terminal cap-like domain-containing protein n=1 Tax=Nocardia sp. NPDC127579 TaxID=3345402 RepID=UPI00363FF12C
MAVVHNTTMEPTKWELLRSWLPTQEWFRGDTPTVRKAGGFRLDDPAGAVGHVIAPCQTLTGSKPALLLEALR